MTNTHELAKNMQAAVTESKPEEKVMRKIRISRFVELFKLYDLSEKHAVVEVLKKITKEHADEVVKHAQDISGKL